MSYLLAAAVGVSVTEAGDMCSWRSREIFPEVSRRTTSRCCREGCCEKRSFAVVVGASEVTPSGGEDRCLQVWQFSVVDERCEGDSNLRPLI